MLLYFENKYYLNSKPLTRTARFAPELLQCELFVWASLNIFLIDPVGSSFEFCICLQIRRLSFGSYYGLTAFLRNVLYQKFLACASRGFLVARARPSMFRIRCRATSTASSATSMTRELFLKASSLLPTPDSPVIRTPTTYTTRNTY